MEENRFRQMEPPALIVAKDSGMLAPPGGEGSLQGKDASCRCTRGIGGWGRSRAVGAGERVEHVRGGQGGGRSAGVRGELRGGRGRDGGPASPTASLLQVGDKAGNSLGLILLEVAGMQAKKSGSVRFREAGREDAPRAIWC